MKGLSAKFHIALGEAFLVVSLLLSALYLDLVPDRLSAVRAGRAALAEAIAASSSGLIDQKDIRRMENTLRLVVERNDDILSAAVRRANGETIITIGDHDRHWRRIPGEYSTETQVLVPIWASGQKWGNIELRASPLTAPGWRGIVKDPRVQLIGFVASLSFIVFYFYLSRMLRHLDPSRAVPGRVRSALDTLAEGLLVIDHNGYIVLANRSFAELMDGPADDLIGRAIADFQWLAADGSGIADEEYPWSATLRDGIARQNATIQLSSVGTQRRTFMVNCSPVLGSGEKRGGVLVSFKDITQLEQKKAELERSMHAADAANQAKSDFLANMSHEIRTPLNAILGFTEVLRRGWGKGQTDSRKYLNTIHSSGNHLLELINDVLDLSKVESGRLEVERLPCSPYKIIGETIQVLGVKARENGITLALETDGPVPEQILCDPARLRQVVTNLVGNAIKFTPQGGVRVVLREMSPQRPACFAIDVIDTGIGIPEDKLDNIFAAFIQADASVTRRFGGTGLGLSISRKFAQALGGDISVQSQPGKGACFTVTLDPGPLENIRLFRPEAISSADNEPDSDARIHWKFPSSRILVVDDGVENRDLIRLVLEEAGLDVHTAENGRAGLDRVLEEPFDLVLMDIQMPVMDGFTAVKAMRQHGVEIPIVALTGHAMKGFGQQCVNAGYSDYLTKPVDIDLLIRNLADRLGAHPVEVTDLEIALAQADDEMSVEQEADLDEGSMISRLSNDPRFHPIIAKFARRLAEQLVALEQAWQERDFDELAALAHWLKGAGGTVGFDAFTEPAQDLEQFAKSRSETGIATQILQLQRLTKRMAVPGAARDVKKADIVPINESISYDNHRNQVNSG